MIMRASPTTLLLLLSVLTSSSWSSPVGHENSNELGQFARRNSPNQCSATYIQSAESKANKSYRQTISTLCSSLQGKYKTVTHSVYTTTVKPKTTIDATNTAPRPIQTGTNTVEVTQTSVDFETSTSVTVVTDVSTETSVVETDIVTVTLLPRNQYPCQKIESLLSLPASSATPFCSCYESGSTSTTTVTYKAATTASPVRITDHTTITPSPSTVFTTVYQTTSVLATEETGTVVTSTVIADVTTSVTDIETTTVAPPQAFTTGVMMNQNPSSQYNNLYGTIGNQESNPYYVGFFEDINYSTPFSVDGSNHLNSLGYTAEQYVDVDANGNFVDNPSNDGLYFDSPSGVASGVSNGATTQPTCTLGPSNLLTCGESGTDTRNVLQICPAGFDSSSSNLPFLYLSTTLISGCEIALLVLVPGN